MPRLRRWLLAIFTEALELHAVRLQVIADQYGETYRKLRAWEMRAGLKGGNHARMEVSGSDDGDLNELLRSRKGF